MATGRTSKRAARQKRKMVLFAFEIIIILVMVVILYMVMNKTSEGPKVVSLDPKNLAIPTEVIEKTEEGRHHAWLYECGIVRTGCGDREPAL